MIEADREYAVSMKSGLEGRNNLSTYEIKSVNKGTTSQ